MPGYLLSFLNGKFWFWLGQNIKYGLLQSHLT